jgi:hypothetical protein
MHMQTGHRKRERKEGKRKKRKPEERTKEGG